MEKIGELLRKLRGKESLREASRRIGISHTYLDTIEKGHDKRSGNPVNPTPETLKLISIAYNYPYKELMKLAGYIEEQDDTEEKVVVDIDDLEEFLMNKIVKLDGGILTEEQKEQAIKIFKIMFTKNDNLG